MPEHAKDRPAGYKNSIEKVAIVGAGGTIGSHLVSALLKTGKHTVTALSRKDSGNKLPDGVQVATVDYSDEATLVDALRGQEFFIITVSPTAPRDTHSKLVQAAAKAGVPYIMPNSYAGDLDQVQLGVDTLLGPVAKANREQIEQLGGDSRFGFDFDKHTLTLYDDGNTRNSVSTLAQVGRAVASLLSFKLFPDDENDKSLTISAWLNKPVYLKSFVVNQNEIFESVKRVTSTSDADWTVTRENTKQRYEEGMSLVKKGNMSGFGKLLYSRAFYPEDPSNCAAKAQNEQLGLPVEQLDDATRDGVELVKELQKRPERMAS